MPAWAARLGPVVEWVAKALSTGVGAGTRRVPTLLTGANRSDGRADVRRGAPRPAIRSVPIARTCRTCGGPIPVRGRDYCDACLPAVVAEQHIEFRTVGTRRLAELRAAGGDPGHSPAANEIRAVKRRESRRAEVEWDAVHGRPDPAVFIGEILPGLRGLPTRRLVESTGLYRSYCLLIRMGLKVPHPRWWQQLAEVALVELA